MKVMTIAGNVPCIHLFVLISGYVILKCMRTGTSERAVFRVVGECRPPGWYGG